MEASREMKNRSLYHPGFLACFVAVVSLLVALAGGSVSHEPTAVTSLTRAQIAAGNPSHGRQLFVQSCAHCHGDDAHGSGEDGDGPDLYRLAIGNARIAAVVRKGIPDEMPSFVKKHGPQDLADLTAYLRSLR